MRGTTKHTRQQIKDEFDRLKARVNVGGRADAGHGLGRDDPREPAGGARARRRGPARARRSRRASSSSSARRTSRRIEQQRSEPHAMGQTALQRHLNPYPEGRRRATSRRPRSRSPSYTSGDARRGEGVLRRASTAPPPRSSPSSATSTRRRSRRSSQRALRRLEEPDGRSSACRVRTWRSSPINQSLETPDKANAFFIAGQNLKIRDDDPDYPALVLGNYMLGGGFLNSRLAVRIRQKDGLSLRRRLAVPGERRSTSPAPSWPSRSTRRRTRRSSRRRSRRRSRGRSKDGFTDQEVKEAKSGWLQGRQVTRAQDAEPRVAARAGSLPEAHARRGTTALEKKVAALTPAQILAAMQKHIDPSKITIVKAGDFAGAARKSSK